MRIDTSLNKNLPEQSACSSDNVCWCEDAIVMVYKPGNLTVAHNTHIIIDTGSQRSYMVNRV